VPDLTELSQPYDHLSVALGVVRRDEVYIQEDV
jgi:hypothetical protein